MAGPGAARDVLAAIMPRLNLPLIAAPMFRVSGPDLVIAACRAGVIGAFPSANCRTPEEFDAWIAQIKSALGPHDAPFCPNLIIRREALHEDIAIVARHRCEMVITSVGAPTWLARIDCTTGIFVRAVEHSL